jgi:soluble lytic murein transglycosylase
MWSRTLASFLITAVLLSPVPIGSTAAADGVGAVLVPDPMAFSVLNGARLLASFGEPRAAHDLAPPLDPANPADADRLRFEVRVLTEMGSYARADSLLAFLEPVGDPDEEFRFYFLRGTLNLLAGRYHRALELLALTDAVSANGLTAYRDFVRLQTNLALDRPGDAVGAGALAMRGEVPAPLSPEFELKLVEALQLERRPDEALEVVGRLKRRVRRSQEMATLLELDYRLYLQSDDLTSAQRTATKLAHSYSRTGEAERTSVDVCQKVPSQDMGSGELLAHAKVMIVHGHYRDARAILRVLDGRQLNRWRREERSILKAQYYYRTGDYRRAAALAKPRFSDRAHRRTSMLILARSQRRMGNQKKAADVYSYFARVYPNDRKAAEALYVAASLYERTGDQRRAQETFYELRKSYPSSYFGKMASYRGADYYFRVRDYDRSVAILQRALKRSRRTDETALYYLARTYGKLGRDDDKDILIEELKNLDPHSFYLSSDVERHFRRPPTTSTGAVAMDGKTGLIAFLAGAAVRKDAARRTLLDVLDPDGRSREIDPQTADCLRRGRWFLEVGFRDWGERELALAGRRCFESPAALLALGEVYDHHGLPWHSIKLYQRVKDSMHWETRREYGEEFGYLMYPVPYPVQVLENAAQYDLPPHLVYAMIREESRFDRNAVSRVGALGLMQLMPETGRYVARELEMPQLTEEGLLDPEVNLAFGIWYASSLYDRSGDDYLWMLAAYNAGPANAKRWFGRRRSGADTIEIVDRIDFKETRRYVQRIVESANVYHTLYFNAAPTGSGR